MNWWLPGGSGKWIAAIPIARCVAWPCTVAHSLIHTNLLLAEREMWVNSDWFLVWTTVTPEQWDFPGKTYSLQHSHLPHLCRISLCLLCLIAPSKLLLCILFYLHSLVILQILCSSTALSCTFILIWMSSHPRYIVIVLSRFHSQCLDPDFSHNQTFHLSLAFSI